MRTVAVIGQKGGAGKSTVSTILAVGHPGPAMIVDLDPQVTSCKWGDRRDRDNPIVVDTLAARLPKVLDRAREGGIGLAVLDTPPRAEEAALAAARAADLVVVPVRPTLADAETVATTAALLQAAGAPRHVVVVTQAQPRTEARTAAIADGLREQGHEVAPVILGLRVAYQDAHALGLAPTELERPDRSAEECRQLYQWIARQVGL